MTIAPKAPRKLSMKQRYEALTRDLDWEPSYVDRDEMFPYLEFEGIKIHDWSKWEDPFRLTVDAYCKYQAEKDKRLYAVLDGFAQGQGHLSLTDANYLNAMKLFLQGVAPNEYNAHRNFAYLARHLGGPGPRFAALCQSIDEMRHTQTEVHTLSNYNKYYSGFHNYLEQHDRVWYLSVPKSFFDDALSAGPFEFLIAIGFSFEYLLTNLLFVPFMSGASFNGDLPTMTFGFSAQSDESRHMTLGLEAIKFLLEQDEANVPIVQAWIDKWFWRGYRVTGLVAQMLDYMLPQGDELEGGLRALLRAADDAGPLPGPRLLRHPRRPSTSRTPSGRRRSCRTRCTGSSTSSRTRGVHDERPGRRAPGVALEDLPGHLRHVLQAALGQGEAQHRGRRPALRPRPAAALPGLPDPDGLHRAG